MNIPLLSFFKEQIKKINKKRKASIARREWLKRQIIKN